VRSKNVPTARLAAAVGLGEVAAAAHRAGINQPLPELPSIALGTVAVSPLELTTAYTPFAGLGTGAEPRLILSVEDEDGHVLWKPEPHRRQAVDPGIAYLITDVLTEALERGTGIAALRAASQGLGALKVPAAGKTGTTNDGADAWFVGYTPDLVTGIWIGFDQPRPILEDATGGRLAAPVWGRMMARFYDGRRPPAPWHRPDGVVARTVDPGTGLLLKEGCPPTAGKAYEELFLHGVEPAAFCPGREPEPLDGFPSTRRTEEERTRTLMAEKQKRAEKKRLEDERRKEEQAKREDEERIARAQRDAKERADRKALLAQKEVARKEKDLAAREAALRRTEEEQKRTARAAKAEQAEQGKRAQRAARAEEEARARDPESRNDRETQETQETQETEETAVQPAPVPIPRPERRPREETEVDVQEESSADDLSGWWELTNRIDETNYDAYRGLRLGYRLHLEQDGDRITGRGQKWSEDGHGLSAGGRTPLTVRGTVHGRTVTLEFTEHGARRATGGVFEWHLSPDRGTLRGSFSSSAAATRGLSVAHRLD
jgi:membrane peptidoglycan carboxypeptidase